MTPYPSTLDSAALAEVAAGCLYERNAYGILMAHPQKGGIPAWAQTGPIADAFIELAALTGRRPAHLMLNILPAGLVIPAHTDREDAGPDGERWHLPIATNPGCFWWDERSDIETHQPLGHWSGPCPNRIRHRVGNCGTTDRTHLIVDTEPT